MLYMKKQACLPLLACVFLVAACEQSEDLSPCEAAQATFTACGLEANLSCELSPPGEHDGHYQQLSEQSCEQLLGEDNPKADLPEAPESWVALGSTSQQSVNWLYQYKDSGFFLFNNFIETLVYLFAGVGDHEDIVKMSNQVSGDSCTDKVLSAGAIVHDYVQNQRGDYNCKHYAATLRAVLSQLNIPTDIEGGMTMQSGHAWTDVTCPDGIISSDAYNNIYVRIGE